CCTTEEFESIDMHVHPIRELLRTSRLGEDHPGRGQHANKQLHLCAFTGLAIGEPGTLAREVHLQPFTSLVRLSQGHLSSPLPAAIAVAECRVTQAVGMLREVLEMEQLERHPWAFQLRMHPSKIRLNARGSRRQRAPVKPLFERGLSQSLC